MRLKDEGIFNWAGGWPNNVSILDASSIYGFGFVVINKRDIMYRRYTIYWEVDGCTGNTGVWANCVEEVKQYFEFNFAKFGYILKGIE